MHRRVISVVMSSINNKKVMKNKRLNSSIDIYANTNKTPRLNETTNKESHDNNVAKKITSLTTQSLQEKELFGKMSKFELLETPVKSASDKKDYRYLQLLNGLKVLLISDPSPILEKEHSEKIDKIDITESPSTTNETEATSSSDDDGDDDDDEDDQSGDEQEEKKEKLAACSLLVDVGAFSDPKDVPGLAHFLEHMIFMGSEKYPKENEYDQFIKKCGGFDNATTNSEETAFYFEVAEKYLDGALDRFSNLFKAPLLLKETMTREREAVESEFQMRFQNDSVRLEQLIASLANPNHPIGNFTWGNLKTLKDNIDDDKLYERVHEFRRRHYSAHRMFVCIQARMTLDQLQELAVHHFSDIPSNGLPGSDFTSFTHSNAFTNDFTEKVFLVKPVANKTKIDITFCTESYQRAFKTKPHNLLGYLLGHEGEGSLCSYLRKKTLALDIVCGTIDAGFENNSILTLFSITINLTQKGFDNIKEVLEALFFYIQYLQNNGIPESHFREVQTIDEYSFRFQEEREPSDNVEDLVTKLKLYPPANILNGDILYFDYNPDAIEKLLNEFIYARANITITSKKLLNNELSFNMTEHWFGTEYCIMDRPSEWQQLWNEPKSFKDEIYLPKSNVFITTDFTILCDKNLEKTAPEFPNKVLENDTAELWFKQDFKFKLPLAYYYFYLISPLAQDSIENRAMLQLYPAVLKFKLVDRLYAANMSGLNYEVTETEMGLMLKIHGYNEKLHRIVEIIGETMQNLTEDLTKENLKMYIESELRGLYSITIKPASLAWYFRKSILQRNTSLEGLWNAVKNVSLNDFKVFSKKFLEKLYIKSLIQGNVNREHAIEMLSGLLNNMKCEKVPDVPSMRLRTKQLNVGNQYFRCSAMNKTDVNTVTYNIYQFGPNTFKLHCLVELFLQIAEEPLFDNLRSKEQLGYDVSCFIYNLNSILAYVIAVQSQEDKFSADFIDARIEKFRSDDIVQIMEKMDEKDFEHHKDSLMKLKSMEDNHLKDEIRRHLSEIQSGEYLYDRIKREIECLKTITKEELVNFYLTHLRENTRKLSVQVIGHKDSKLQSENKKEEAAESIFTINLEKPVIVDLPNDGRGHLITNIDDFMSTLEYYPNSNK